MKYKVWCLVIAFCIAFQGASFAADTAARLNLIEQSLPELEALLLQCESFGMDMGYERADLAVIRDFITYGRQDISWGDDERAAYVADCLEKLYLDAESKLKGYLDGRLQPFEVKRNLPQNYGGTEGSNFVDKSGKPIIQNGYGVFAQLKNDLHKMQEFGADLVQIEIGPNAVLASKGSINGWSFRTYGDGQGTCEVVSGGRNNSANALKIANTTPAGKSGYLAVSQNVEVHPNTTYTLTVSVRTVSAGDFFFSPQGWVAERTYIAKGTNTWSDYTATYTTGPDEYSMEILFISSSASTAIYLDDIALRKTTNGENLIQNGNFEDSLGEQTEHFQANTAAIRNRVSRVLDEAYANGVMVNVLISPHYFPAWILDSYPETKAVDSGMGYDMNHPVIREALDLYIKTLMSEIGTHPALHSICITNEPVCDTRKTSGLEEEYSNYLKEIYDNDIERLNNVYGSSYTSFSQVAMPKDDSLNPAYYDWVKFNNNYTASWHRFLAETVKKYQPNVAVHSKMMTIFGKKDSLNFGVDPEDFAEFTDINGNDTWGFYGSTAKGLLSKLMWYDLLRSIKPHAPVINSEDHIIEDGNTNYSPNQAVHVAADIWQGAVHGRDASIIWIWGRSRDKSSSAYGNILYRPDVLSAVSKKSFDLNRLSEAVAALQEGERKATILYSPTARAYSESAVAVLSRTYEAALYAGTNPGFITERQLERGIKPQGLLIVPGVEQISDAALAAIKEYYNQGGKVLLLGGNSLSKTVYNKNREGTNTFSDVVPLSVQGGNVISPTASALQLKIGEILGLEMLKNADGTTAENIDWTSASLDGRVLWNLCSYDWSGAKYIAIGKQAVDLLTGTVYTGTVELKPFVPVLLELYDMKPRIGVQADIAKTADGGKITVRMENSGNCAGYLELYIRVKDNETGRFVQTAFAKKYINAGGISSLSYFVPLPSGEYSVSISGLYGEENVPIDEITIPFVKN